MHRKINFAFTKLIETNAKMCLELLCLSHISLVAILSYDLENQFFS